MSDPKTVPECLRPMTPEELANFQPLSEKAIEEALRKGAEDARKMRNALPTRPGWYR